MIHRENQTLVISPPLAIFSLCIALFALILVNGYALNFLSLPANAWLILTLMLVEGFFIARWILCARSLRIQGDPLELAGFLIVIAGTWAYFVYASLPTLLPPTISSDATRHQAYASSIFASGHIIADYPGGAALVTATLAHWIGWVPLRLMHPLGALWLALTAGGIYALACAMLPNGRAYKTIALIAPFALFIPWNYFGEFLMGRQYFFTQVSAQLAVVACVWFLNAYRESHHLIWSVGIALSVIWISVSFTLWLVVPLAMLGLSSLDEWHKDVRARGRALGCALIVSGALALFWLAVLLVGSRFVPQSARLAADGFAVPPSFESLGGAYWILPALGMLLLARVRSRVWTAVAFLASCALVTLGMSAAHLWLGVAQYWLTKSLFLLNLPVALFAVIPFARAIEFAQRFSRRQILSSAAAFAATALMLATLLPIVHPPRRSSPLTEAEIQVALWAKANLNTRHVHYISRKSVTAQWLGVALWEEKFAEEEVVDLLRLGPRTFEEWRDDPAWGEYLFVSSNQRFPLDAAMRVVYQRGDSAILQKPAPAPRAGADNLGRFGDLLALADYALSRQTLRAGEVISLTAQIETGRVPSRQVVWRLQLRDPQGNAAAEVRRDPFESKFPLNRWPDGRLLSQPLTLPLPVDLRPGLYNLQLGLYYIGSGEPLRYQAADGAADDVAHLGQIKIALPPVTTRELGLLTRTDVKMGDAFALLGYRLHKHSPIRPGDSIPVTLYWQSLARAQLDYTVFVHLLDASGALRAQRDTAPRNGTYPTSIWEPGEIITDAYVLTVPREAVPGDYSLAVGMYQWPSLRRLPVTRLDNQALGDHVLLPGVARVVSQ